ncbi:MAG: hypothetical protein WD554_01860 [Flavobacteriaceae bacterium]
MKNTNLYNHLKELFQKEQLPPEEPKTGHQMRFMKKLEAQNQKPVKQLVFWKPMAIAASFLIIIALGFPLIDNSSNEADLASISPEMAETQQFFMATIKSELSNLKKEDAPEAQKLIQDALLQMEILENDYEKLKKDLAKSGNDKRVIYAMISNFQSRIDLLEDVLQQIETIKELKQDIHETTI